MRCTLFYILSLCCLLHAATLQLSAAGSRQYAYVSSVKGIYEYRVGHDGGLKPLTAKPVKGSPGLAQILVDRNTNTLYAIDQSSSFEVGSTTDHIYCYAIGRNGRLSSRTPKPTSLRLGVKNALIDPNSHLLYVFDGDKNLAIYDIQNPPRVQQRHIVLLPAEAESLFSGRNYQSLILVGERRGLKGQPIGGRLLQYATGTRNGSPLKLAGSYPTSQWITVATFAGRYLVAGGWGNTLAIYDMGKTGLHIFSYASVPKNTAGNFLRNIAYLKGSNVLYVSAFSQPFSPRVDPSSTTIAAYRLSSDGHLQLLKTETSRPVPNPTPFLDESGRFLYVTSQAGNSIDAYRIARDGRLSPAVSRLKIESPTEMAFVISTGK